MNLIDQLNAHPYISKAALTKHEPAIRWGMDPDIQTAVRVKVKRDEWPESCTIIMFVDDELLEDAELIRHLVLQEADEQAKGRYA